jgi:hypothetical protein
MPCAAAGAAVVNAMASQQESSDRSSHPAQPSAVLKNDEIFVYCQAQIEGYERFHPQPVQSMSRQRFQRYQYGY